ncbi:MAG TPA: 3-hydroxyacyl-CoA dehydrogenase NAD-binding domain-containing protein [Hyphomicrobiaceae bacterium]|jgi:3-hydroxyacyl-CoA dehydrogenase/enoyl-CoA hydratase/3-hydroxybutyryl-CoA epimerase|nr:3-hydroxyacyl-CoA dehydrogenase NAD-binding domain-containing protein [Hyphomicrobiaceae bacterium]
MADVKALRDWRYSVDRQGTAWAVFDREGESQNSLGRRPLEELGAIVEEVERAARDRTVRGLVFISGKEKGFIVGADVREFEGLADERQIIDSVTVVNAYLDRIERLPVPVVCCIHGFCLGGGLELALACHWRIATRDDATRVGFPEVRLGIFPGFNGTVRSIRQAGALSAMPLMLQGSMIRAGAARGMGLIDELVASPLNLPWAARKAIERKRKSRGAPLWKDLVRQWPARGLFASKLRSETAKKVREDHYPAPFRLIDLFETHAGHLDGMKVAETRAFAPLMLSDTARNLRRVFKLSEMLKAQAPKDLNYKPLRAHVIGAGVMGADIAGWCVASGMEVSLQDVNPEQIAKGIEAQKKLFRRKFKTRAQRDAARARLIADPQGTNIGRADIVIEAVVERLDVKQSLFQSIEGKLKPGAVLATNTSSIMIEDIAKPLADPGRLIGIHFFNPVAQMPLVEVIRGAGSREEEVRKGCAFVTAIDKFPLVVKSSPGFLVNRVLGPYMMGALQRVERGEAKEKIDEAARTFGMPMGPVELADTVGLDVCAHVGRILNAPAGEASKLDQMVAAGKLGKKSGEGFYVWKDGKPQKTEPETPYDKYELERLGRELVDPLIRECERCRDERIVESADLVDAGVIFGTGFAPFRGGPLHFKANEQKSNVEPLRRPAAE